MRCCPDAVEVRAIVRRELIELGVGAALLRDLEVSILIDEGKPRARTYRIAHLMAMWLIEIGIIQYYDEEGNMLRRTNLLAEIEPRRMAA